jgi:hypothetical protein
LKKRSKKLLSMQVRAAVTMSGHGAGEGAKVFWFFFSKKNRFLTAAPPDDKDAPPKSPAREKSAPPASPAPAYAAR